MRRFVEMIVLAFSLSGCAGAFSVPPPERPVEEIVRPDVTETPDFGGWCFTRARLFRGLVPVKCLDLAREFRP